MSTALLSALAIATLAALADWRDGQIRNWITLPPLAAAPIAYGFLLGPSGALLCIVSAVACAFVPYGVFRNGGMGGGDVKLFAALGATTGFDIITGLEIQLVSLGVAALVAVFVLFGNWLRRVSSRPMHGHTTAAARKVSIRLGAPVLLGTCFVSLRRLAIEA